MNKWFPARFSAHRGGGGLGEEEADWQQHVILCKESLRIWSCLNEYADARHSADCKLLSLGSGTAVPDLNRGGFNLTPQVRFNFIFNVLYVSTVLQNKTHRYYTSPDWWYIIYKVALCLNIFPNGLKQWIPTGGTYTPGGTSAVWSWYVESTN